MRHPAEGMFRTLPSRDLEGKGGDTVSPVLDLIMTSSLRRRMNINHHSRGLRNPALFCQFLMCQIARWGTFFAWNCVEAEIEPCRT